MVGKKTANGSSKLEPGKAASKNAASRIKAGVKASNGEIEATTIGDYLIQRMRDCGLRDVFGIPGDFVLGFYGMLEESPLRVVGTTREDCAGYAADAYARVHGLGAVCVTYCVGGLSLCNSIAGAFAEKSPVIVISGAPGMDERRSDPLLHHRVRDFNTQREVFEKITVASALLDDPLTAFREIDRCLDAAMRYQRPVYLELPRDRVHSKSLYSHKPTVESVESDPKALKEAIAEAAERLQSATKPIILAGVEVHRFGMREQLLKLAEKHQIPISATLLGKSVVSEQHPLFIGIYEGAMGQETVRKYVEQSDCVIMLGTFMTDINLGIFTARLDPGKCISATSENLRIGYHHFKNVQFEDFVTQLTKAKIEIAARKLPAKKEAPGEFIVKADQPVSTKRLFERVNGLLDENMVVIADVGDSLFGAADLNIYRHTEFLSPAYYTSMGFAIPAALGVQVADKSLRPLVLVGDGAFQMTCMELSSTLKYGFNPIVLVLNNKGYTTERFIQEGPFNDIPNWEYHRMPDLLGGGWGFEVHTEGDLDKALNAALANQDAFSLLNIHLPFDDISPALKRLASRLSENVGSADEK